MRQAIIYPGEDGVLAGGMSKPAGCISQGKTKQEAIVNIKEAIRGMSPRSRKTTCPFPKSAPTLSSWRCDQAPLRLRTGMRPGRSPASASCSEGRREAT